VRPVVRPPSAAEYLRAAASLDLFEIRSSELALARARDPRLREFARMMISAHRGTSAQLSLAGRRLGLLPEPKLLPREQSILEELAASTDFDATYRGHQIRAHTAAVTLHSSYSAHGASPTLRPVAANALPIVRGHLQLLRSR
jgi:putative membrane protein